MRTVTRSESGNRTGNPVRVFGVTQLALVGSENPL